MTERRKGASRVSRYRGRAVRATWRTVSSLIPANGNVDDFVAAVSEQRGRRIAVLSCSLPDDGPSGFWAPTPDVDYILHADSITAEYRETVICHEIAHMVLGHVAREGLMDTRAIAPSVSPAVAARFLAREGYPDEIESDAEMLATLIAAELVARAEAGSRAATQTQDHISARLR